MLSDSESDVSLHALTINEHYAKAFEYRKEREELQKLKDKYGSDGDDDEDSETDSEDAESEDEDGEELTPAMDAAILRTLAKIKRKDPDIYDAEKDIFREERKKIAPVKMSSRTAKDKSKSITMRQITLQAALNPTSRSPSPQPLPHVEEQRVLRDETIAAFHNAVEEDESDDLLIPREKTKDELEKEEEDYRLFLEKEVGQDLANLVTVDPDVALREESAEPKDIATKKKRKKSQSDDASKSVISSSKTKEGADQEFLMSYILNRGWIDRAARRVPTYGEIVTSKGEEKESAAGSDAEGYGNELDEDEFDEIEDRFESSYNFRFEEPDGAAIKTYPRNLPSLVRREDTTRKEARERRKQRKEEEHMKKKEEVKRLKALKMKEIREKLDRIGREGGKNYDKDQALQELDLEGDWDPDAHDRQMAGLYADDGVVDEDKPQWDDDIDIEDIINTDAEKTTKAKKKKKKKKEKEAEEVGQEDGVDIDAMDADVEKFEDEEEWDGTEEMRKRKLNEYMDEIYGLDFNDVVGDMPTRFKYIPVLGQNYALTPAEILVAADADLNEYMGVKKFAPYRTDAKWDSTRGDRLKRLKQKISERGGAEMGVDGKVAGSGERQKKRKGKKERMKMKASVPDGESGEHGEAATVKQFNEVEGVHKDLKHKREFAEVDEVDLESEGIVAGKKKRRRRKKKDVLSDS